MADAKIGKGYACAICRKLYPHSATGKKMANACCTCRVCSGTAGMSYLVSAQSICQACWEEKEWNRVVRNLAAAQADYDMRSKLFNRRAPEVERRYATPQSGASSPEDSSDEK